MFGDIFGGGTDLTVFFEFLRYKGIVNDNVMTWLEASSGPMNCLTGGSSIKEMFKDKDNVTKDEVCKFMEHIPWKDYQEISKESIRCGKCKSKISVEDGSFFVKLVCPQCGEIKRDSLGEAEKGALETDNEAFMKHLAEYAVEHDIDESILQ